MLDINIMGVQMNDTVLYLSRILNKLSKGSVIIRDYTRNHELYSCVPAVAGIDPAEDIIDYAGIGYTFSNATSEKYDTCIRLYDIDRMPDYEDATTLIIADESKRVSDALNAMDWSDFLDEGTKIMLLVKHYTGVVRKQYDPLVKNANIKHKFQIPMNAHDVKCGILAEHNEKYVFNSISTQFQEALMDITRVIRSDLEMTIKESEKLFKEVSKGAFKK